MSFVRPLKGIKTNTQKQKTEHNKKQKTTPDKWYLKNQTNNNKKNGYVCMHVFSGWISELTNTPERCF